MMTPNRISGMKLKGIGRARQTNHIKKEHKSFRILYARAKKAEREQAQYIKANREYMF